MSVTLVTAALLCLAGARPGATQAVDDIIRKNLDEGWRISTAKVHGGLTHAQWMSGSIPVSPFPRDAYGDTR